MNPWKIIWNAYHENSTTPKFLKNVLSISTRKEKIILFILAIFFFTGIVLLLISPVVSLPISSAIYFWFVVLGELGLIFQIEKQRRSFIKNEFRDVSQLQTPHDDKCHKTSRYLTFRKILEENSVTSKHVQDCQELIDLQIDIASSEGLIRKKFGNFVIGGIFLGVLGTFWSKLEIPELIYIFATLILISALIYFVLYLIPSKLEKLKEMKYFMLLYHREFKHVL